MTTLYATMPSPVGPLTLAGDGDAVTMMLMNEQPNTDWKRDTAALREALEQMRAYFARELKEFSLRLAARGTPFQHKVWAALREIPYGETVSYGYIAARIGQPTASRAVGMANSRNPIGIIVPCHRVIGASGTLTGYAGGLERKRWLLDHEQGILL